MATDPGGSWGVVTAPYTPPELGPQFTLPSCGCVSFGDGPPANGTGSSGDIYVDDLTEIIYQNQNGTWVVLGGGGGSAGAILFQGHFGGAPPPITPTVPLAIAKDQDAPFPSWWWDGSAWQ